MDFSTEGEETFPTAAEAFAYHNAKDILTKMESRKYSNLDLAKMYNKEIYPLWDISKKNLRDIKIIDLSLSNTFLYLETARRCHIIMIKYELTYRKFMEIDLFTILFL